MELGDGGVFEECMKDGCVRFGHSNDWSDEDWSDADYVAYDALMNRFEERWGPGSKQWWNSTSAATFRSKVNRGDVVVVPDGVSKSQYRAVGKIVDDYEYTPRSSSPLWPHRRAVHWHWQAVGNPDQVGDFQEKGFGGQRVHELHPDHPEALLKHLGEDTNPLPYVLVVDENQPCKHRQGVRRIDHAVGGGQARGSEERNRGDASALRQQLQVAR